MKIKFLKPIVASFLSAAFIFAPFCNSVASIKASIAKTPKGLWHGIVDALPENPEEKDRFYNWLDEHPLEAEKVNRLASAQSFSSTTNTIVHGKITPEFYHEATRVWAGSYPKEVNEFLAEKGCTFHIGPTGTAIDPLYKNVTLGGETEQRTHYNHRGGHFSPSDNFVETTEYQLSIRSEEKQFDKNDIKATDLVSGGWNIQEDVSHTVLHEKGHAIDFNVRKVAEKRVSETEAFKKAYDADVDRMGNTTAACFYSYFAHPKKDPRDCHLELFAEISARQESGVEEKDHYVNFKRDWPNCYKLVDKFYKDFPKLYAQGDQGIMDYIKQMDSGSFDINATVDEKTSNGIETYSRTNLRQRQSFNFNTTDESEAPALSNPSNQTSSSTGRTTLIPRP